jgi:hypothetical protein
LSIPKHWDRRDAIRNGWHDSSKFVGIDSILKFVVSTNDEGVSDSYFVEESQLKKDIIFCGVPSGFHNIIRKVSCGMKDMLRSYTFDFFLKTDDDSTICLGSLLNTLYSQSNLNAAYFGRKLKIERNIPTDKPLFKNLGLIKDPQHFGGHGYGISYDVVVYIQWLMEHFSIYHHLHEDTNFGLWMMPLNINRVSIESMTKYIKSNNLLFHTNEKCKKYSHMKAKGYTNISNDLTELCENLKRPDSVGEECYKIEHYHNNKENFESKNLEIMYGNENINKHYENLNKLYTEVNAKTKVKYLYLIYVDVENTRRRDSIRHIMKTKCSDNDINIKHMFIVTTPSSNNMYGLFKKRTLHFEIKSYRDIHVQQGQNLLTSFTQGLTYSLQNLEFEHVFVFLDDRIAIPTPCSINKAYIQKTQDCHHSERDCYKRQQYSYGGGRKVWSRILSDPSILRLGKGASAPIYFRDGVLMSYQVARYLHMMTKNDSNISLIGSQRVIRKAEEVEMLIGFWLSPLRLHRGYI